jgi:hypothetical protein
MLRDHVIRCIAGLNFQFSSSMTVNTAVINTDAIARSLWHIVSYIKLNIYNRGLQLHHKRFHAICRLQSFVRLSSSFATKGFFMPCVFAASHFIALIKPSYKCSIIFSTSLLKKDLCHRVKYKNYLY